MRILGVIPTEKGKIGACEWYRVVEPLQEMQRLGHQCFVEHATELTELVKNGKNPFPLVDLVLFQRLVDTPDNTGLWQKIAKAVRFDAGVAIAVDYDDDYTNEHRVVTKGVVPDLTAFSAVVVSTPYLKKVMTRYNKRVHVIPNLVHPEMINANFKRVLPNLTIGLTGSTTHREDWKAVVDPVTRILAKYPEVRLFCSGYIPPEFKGHPQLVTLKDMGANTDQDDFFIPLEQYGYILRNIDIGLCPVSPADKFNFSKSSLKSLELQASIRSLSNGVGGAAVIATGDVPLYRDTVQSWKTGILVDHNDAEGWYKALDRLISDVSLREQLQRAGHESCMKNWNIHTRISERVATFSEILEDERRVQRKAGMAPRTLAVAG